MSSPSTCSLVPGAPPASLDAVVDCCLFCADVMRNCGWNTSPSSWSHRSSRPRSLHYNLRWVMLPLNPFIPKNDQVKNFPCSLTRNITSHSMENPALHGLLRWKMIILPILTTSLIHFYLKGWENVLFELVTPSVQPLKLQLMLCRCFRRLSVSSPRPPWTCLIWTNASLQRKSAWHRSPTNVSHSNA